MPISTSSAYSTANAKLNKVPIFLFEIEDYHYGFSNADLGEFPAPVGSFYSPATSSAFVPVDFSLGYGNGATTGPSSGYIQRWGSNSIIGHGAPGNLFFYAPTGFYGAPGSDNPASPPRSKLAAVYAQVTFNMEAAPGGFVPFWAISVSVDGGSTWITVEAPVLTAGTFTVTVDITSHISSLATFDFNNVQLLVNSNSSLFSSNPPPGSVFTVESAGLLFGLSLTSQRLLIGIDDLQLTVNDLEGGADLADLVLHVQDRAQIITADFPNFVFEGKKAFLLSGWGHIDPVTGFAVPDMDVADFATLFTGTIDSVESENSNNDYCFTCSDNSSVLSRVVFGVADDGFATDSKHTRTLNGHPLDILLAILQDELQMDAADIDITKIQTYRDTIYSGAQMQFTIDSPPVAKDFIENEILKPMAAYRYTDNLGRFTVNFAYPLTADTVFGFTPDNLLGIPEAGQADLTNQVSTRFDVDSQGNFLSESVEQDDTSVAKYGMYGQLIIESKGLRSGLNGFFLAGITAFLIFMRYGSKALCHGDNGKNSASSPINAIWSAALLAPGDLVLMTHPLVPDRATGTLGITDKAYIVMDRNWQFFQGNVQYKLVEIDLSKFKQFLITTNGQADYTGSSPDDQATLMFLCGDDDKYSNGNPANTLC